MRLVIFAHSVVSDWNHGNAHFLRGVATELIARGHDVELCEPADGWSRSHLLKEAGPQAIADFETAYPLLKVTTYDPASFDLSSVLRGADVVIVHEWNPRELVRQIGEHRARHGSYRLFFHDTHHRGVTDPDSMAAYDLSRYDGVLAFGKILRDLYLRNRWARQAWTWHEAADTRVFHPLPGTRKTGDLVWIGNWGDGERTRELREFLIAPVARLGLRARVYGVRYPPEALEELRAAGIEYGGWLPNFRVPEVFAHFRVTVHVPRGPYATTLAGIPTIRPFEALACGIPLVSAPWSDAENLFRPGRDYLCARDGDTMTEHLRLLLLQPSDTLSTARSLTEHGLETIQKRHTCAHRVDELLDIAAGAWD